MLDFNDAPGGHTRKVAGDGADAAREKDEIRAALNDQLPLLALDIWPSGKRRQNKYLVGDVMGGPGDSLELLLSGPKVGLWTDRATGEGGDILDLADQLPVAGDRQERHQRPRRQLLVHVRAAHDVQANF